MKQAASDKPKVSVSLITYNHKKFIAQAIEGVVRQQTTFPIEVIIGDDFSTDGTRDIILDYQQRYPEIIKPILHPQKNPGLGGKLNFLSTIYAAQGEYIALLDGDDYWTDPLKLQKQVDFLEANPDFALCFHRVQVVHEAHIRPDYVSNKEQKDSSTFEDLAGGNYIHTLSCIYRNHLFGDFPAWFIDSPVGDYVLHLLNAQHGKIKFLAETMGVYRVHSGGVWESQDDHYRHQKMIWVIEKCRQQFTPLGYAIFTRQIKTLTFAMAQRMMAENHLPEARYYCAKYLSNVWREGERKANWENFKAFGLWYLMSYSTPTRRLYRRIYAR